MHNCDNIWISTKGLMLEIIFCRVKMKKNLKKKLLSMVIATTCILGVSSISAFAESEDINGNSFNYNLVKGSESATSTITSYGNLMDMNTSVSYTYTDTNGKLQTRYGSAGSFTNYIQATAASPGYARSVSAHADYQIWSGSQYWSDSLNR
jgi:hypothetical protein